MRVRGGAGEDERQWEAMRVEAEAELRLDLAESLWADLVTDAAAVVREVEHTLTLRNLL